MKIKILFIAIAFLIPCFADAGCFSKDDIKFEITKSPDVKCLEIEIKDRCQGHELEITNYCDSAVIYKNGDGEKIRITRSYSDPDIPMDFISWTREFHLEENPSDKVLIKIENKKIDGITLFLKNDLEYVLGIILGIIALIFTLAGVVNIIKTSFRKKKKNNK